MDIEKLLKAYKPPFVCDEEMAMVLDSEQHAVIVVRGWSRLNQIFEENEAFEFQLQIARFVAKELNERASRIPFKSYPDTIIVK